MTKFMILIFFISAFDLSYGQVDTTTVNGTRVIVGLDAISHTCQTFTKKNKTYEIQIGETYHRTAPANGWFTLVNDNCYRSTWIQSMVSNQFYLRSEGIYYKFKKGKLYSGKIREYDGEYRITGRCRRGQPFGKFIISNVKNDSIIWEGIIRNTNK